MNPRNYLEAATPNEIGDTLAGYAGTLAFVWTVVTVCLQAIELREQRAEFTRMADAQGEQVKLLVSQGAIFEDEQKERSEARSERLLDQILMGITYQTSSEHVWGTDWVLPGIPEKRGEHTLRMFAGLNERQGATTIDEDILAATHSMLRFHNIIMGWQKNEFDFEKGENKLSYQRILYKLYKAIAIRDKLSADQMERFDNLEVGYFHSFLSAALNSDIWVAADESSSP